MEIPMHSPQEQGWGNGTSSLPAIIRKKGIGWFVPVYEQDPRQRRNPVDLFLRNYVDLFPKTSGGADIQMDVSSHIETVVLLSKKFDESKIFFDVGVEAKDYYRI